MRALFVIAVLIPACHSRAASRQMASIGSACAFDWACGTGRFECATDHKGGYCVARCHADDECPRGSVCVGVDAVSLGNCHAVCDPTHPSCRTGYACVSADASHAYCDMPGSRSLWRRIRSRAWR